MGQREINPTVTRGKDKGAGSRPSPYVEKKAASRSFVLPMAMIAPNNLLIQSCRFVSLEYDCERSRSSEVNSWVSWTDSHRVEGPTEATRRLVCRPHKGDPKGREGLKSKLR